MTRTLRLASTTVFLVAALLSNAPSAQLPLQTIGGYIKISEVRVSRTVFEYVYRATLTNTGGALAGATAVASSSSPALTIVEGSLTFGPVGSGGSVVSLDTFTFRHDRSVPFDFANVLWTITPTPANLPPVAHAGPDQDIVGIGVVVHLDGSASADPELDPLTYHWTLTDVPAGSTATLSSATASNPTFVPDHAGVYVAELVVNDGTASSAPDSVVVSVGNTAPVAHAGADQTRGVGAEAILTGAASSDVDGDALSFSWAFQSRPAGSGAVLSDPSSVSPRFTIDVPGNYVVGLIVNDGTADSAPDLVVISTDNSAPVADAGPHQTVLVGQTVALNGSASSDVDGDPLTFAWTIVERPAGSSAALDNPTAVAPSFVADEPGSYRVRLIVHDGTLASDPDVVEINTGNSPPVAHAGPDQSASVSTIVMLDGSASTDVDGDALTFSWALTTVPPGSTATLSSPTAVTPTFTVDVAGVFVAQLVVNDGTTDSPPDSVTITTENSAPLANAGPDQSVEVGQVAILDGTASSDVDGDALTFSWSLTTRPAGSTAVLVAPASPAPSFTADVPGSYIVQLVVNDGTLSSVPDTVTISTLNVVPVAHAGPDQLDVPVGSLVGLDGGASTDADGHPLTFSWSLLSKPAGSGAVLSTPTAVAPTFTADVAGEYTVQLVVNDGLVNSAPDTVLVRTAGATPPVVTVDATDATAAEAGGNTGTVVFTRTGSLSDPLTVHVSLDGTAANGTDYALVGSSITIPASSATATLVIAPLADNVVEPVETIGLTILEDAAYQIGVPATATLTIADDPAVVQVSATDPSAAEAGPNPGVFQFTRSGGDLTSPLVVTISRSGTATPGDDYVDSGLSVTIPATQASATLTITPVADGVVEGDETVIATIAASASYVIGASSTATVTIGDAGCTTVPGPMINGFMHCGAITTAGEVDTWSFTAVAGDRIAISLGQVVDDNDFRPWIRLVAPGGTVLANTSGVAAAVIDSVAAPATGTYQVQVASFDSFFDGTGTYRLTLGKSPGPITVAPEDQGGPLTNGAMHLGEILVGDLDVWTFTATAGDRIAIQAGDIVDTGDLRPWLRLYAPNGTVLANTSGVAAAAIDSVAAPVTGTYLVLVASFDSGLDGTGTYRLTMTRTPGPVTVSPGDQGGPLGNGALHTGEIVRGDLDVWTFTANVGDRIAIHAGEVLDNDDLRPWLRLYAPNGTVLANTSGVAAAAIDSVAAPVTGTYLVLVASFDSGFDGTGTYRLTMTHSPGPITVSPGDQGGPLGNGTLQTGEIQVGDLDVWTFTATAGDRIAIQAGDIVDTGDLRPWLRLYAPNGTVLGNTSGVAAAAIDGVAAPVTGTYLVLVASFDSGLDGTGTYRLTLGKSPGPVTVSPGDQGGPLGNGALHTGEIVRGDLDVWTFTANVGDRIAIHAGEVLDNDDLRPWLRLYAPNGTVLANTSGVAAAAIDSVAAPVTGTYLVLVASFDSGLDGTGTYRLTMTRTPGPVTVSPGDQGGPLGNGALHTGEIVRGDLDVWTFTANVGDRIAIHAGEVLDNDDLRPWLRLYAPNGTVLANTSGVAAAAIDSVAAPVTGTYLVLVASFDSGFDGTGTYRLTMTHSPGPITVSPGDQGGTLTNGVASAGAIVPGDLDVWTITAVAGQQIDVLVSQTSETDDFRPWLRLYAPNGAVLANTSGVDVASVTDAVAPVTGTYLVLVASFDSGLNGNGTYSVTATVTGP